MDENNHAWDPMRIPVAPPPLVRQPAEIDGIVPEPLLDEDHIEDVEMVPADEFLGNVEAPIVDDNAVPMGHFAAPAQILGDVDVIMD